MSDNYGKGSFLIANPVLPDPNFSRTVVLLCNHDAEGSFGLVVNRVAEIDAEAALESIQFPVEYKQELYLGGPVSQSQLFYLCRSENPLYELDRVCPNVYFGMSFELLPNVVSRLADPKRDLRFYLGYSGWGGGQLAGEMERRSWLTCDASAEFVFSEDEDTIWAGAVRSMGEEYAYLVNAPINPQWN